jgi:hypothetical protein
MSGYGGYSFPYKGDLKPKGWDPDYKPEDKGYPSWNESFGIFGKKDEDKPRMAGEIFEEIGKQFGDSRGKYRSEAERSERPVFGDSNKGNAGQVLENLGAMFPQQHAPVYMPGVQGSSPLGTIGRIAGTIAGGFLGGPLGIGAAAGMAAGGNIGGGIGSMF